MATSSNAWTWRRPTTSAPARPTTTRKPPSRSPRSARPCSAIGELAPHVVGGFDHESEFVDLLLLGDRIALERGREAALGRETKLIERHKSARFVDAPLEPVL